MNRCLYLILCITALFLFNANDSEARIKYKKATRLGMIKDDPSAADKNFTLLQDAISNKRNVKLNGTFYVKFPKPIILDYTLHITGGEMRIVSGNCFDFIDGGGFVAEKTVFRRENIDEGKTLCGKWNLYGETLVDKFHFIDSKYYGRYLLQLSFEDINSDEINFGINSLIVNDSYLHNGGRVLILNGVIGDKCEFSNNTFESFPITPIYICYSHSKTRYPDESDAYLFVENNIKRSADVYINGNKFYGKPVSLDYYYCSALVESVRCYFQNNLLKDIINYTDGSNLTHATCYDAYLSCAEVYFTGNTIENMMSFSMNGGNKPQCEIGKSKINVLSGEDYKTVRHYESNVYSVDGSVFLRMGATQESLYSNIFNNFDYVDTYNWINNRIIYHDADIAGRSSSSGYGSFVLRDNHFQADSISGYGLCMMSTNNPFQNVEIINNDFILNKPSVFYLFNQVYKWPYTLDKGNIDVANNRFVNAIPKISCSVADTVTISNNMIDSYGLKNESNYYITNYTGSDVIPNIDNMSIDLPYVVDGTKGNSIVNISTNSSGVFKYSIPKLSKTKSLSGNVYLLDKTELRFDITYRKSNLVIDVPIVLAYDNVLLSCHVNSTSLKINDNKYSVIYNKDGILFQIRFIPSQNKLYYSLTSTDTSNNDEDTLVALQITL